MRRLSTVARGSGGPARPALETRTSTPARARVIGGRQPGRPGADDDDLVLFHDLPTPFIRHVVF